MCTDMTESTFLHKSTNFMSFYLVHSLNIQLCVEPWTFHKDLTMVKRGEINLFLYTLPKSVHFYLPKCINNIKRFKVLKWYFIFVSGQPSILIHRTLLQKYVSTKRGNLIWLITNFVKVTLWLMPYMTDVQFLLTITRTGKTQHFRNSNETNKRVMSDVHRGHHLAILLPEWLKSAKTERKG